MKILIVDDSMSARFYIKNCIPEAERFQFYEAVNGRIGVEQYLEVQPDITFLDITMPEMDGFQALSLIKEADPEALVIILTSDIHEKTVDRINSLGAFMFLKKPPGAETIADAVGKALKELGDKQ